MIDKKDITLKTLPCSSITADTSLSKPATFSSTKTAGLFLRIQFTPEKKGIALSLNCGCKKRSKACQCPDLCIFSEEKFLQGNPSILFYLSYLSIYLFYSICSIYLFYLSIYRCIYFIYLSIYSIDLSSIYSIYISWSEYVEMDGCLDGLGLLDIFASRLHPKVVLMESSCLRMQLAGKNLVVSTNIMK